MDFLLLRFASSLQWSIWCCWWRSNRSQTLKSHNAAWCNDVLVLAFFKICVANFTLQSTIMGLGLQFFSLMRMDLQWCCWFHCRSLVHLIRAESTVMIPNLLILSQPCCSFHHFLVNFDFWHFSRLLLWNSRLPYALVASCWSLWPKKDEITWVHDFLRLINFQICLSFGYIVNCRLSPNSNNS